MNSLIETTLASSSEISSLGIMHLKRYWQKSLLNREGMLDKELVFNEWMIDNALLSALGLGLSQATNYLYQNTPDFDRFESWVLETTGGGPSPAAIQRFNALAKDGFSGMIPRSKEEAGVLTESDLAHWNDHGYVIVRNAVSIEDCDAAIEVICDHTGIKRSDPSTWHNPHPSKNGIMIQLFQHPALQRTRSSEKIRIAYEQIWERKDIWLQTDRVGFNPPETASHKYQGQGLHWDVSLQLPIPLATQGILYLSDTAENQGAFSLVPGFQHRIGEWLASLPEGKEPRNENIDLLGVKRIAANAGDMIIWQHALPHGSSPNTSDVPRFVQYINYKPVDMQRQKVWK